MLLHHPYYTCTPYIQHVYTTYTTLLHHLHCICTPCIQHTHATYTTLVPIYTIHLHHLQNTLHHPIQHSYTTYTTLVHSQCLIQDKIFTSPPRAVVAPRGRRTARSSNWAILLFSDIKFNNIIITTNNYIYLLKSNSIMLQVIVHNKNNSEN